MTIFLKNIKTTSATICDEYPFNIPAYSQGINIEIKSPVLILVGENGAGKSTLLDAVADNCGFSQNGGNQYHYYGEKIENKLSKKLRLSWFPKTKQGFFMRAESFTNFSNYIDQLAIDYPGIYEGYGGKSLNNRSHGEAFFSLFSNHFKKGIFILDEPESALSPAKQLAFLALIKELINNGSQLIIATHSPLIMSIPSAQVMLMNNDGINKVSYKETQHYQITKLFLDSPERFHKQL